MSFAIWRKKVNWPLGSTKRCLASAHRSRSRGNGVRKRGRGVEGECQGQSKTPKKIKKKSDTIRGQVLCEMDQDAREAGGGE